MAVAKKRRKSKAKKAKPKAKATTRAPKLSPEEKAQRKITAAHLRSARGIFDNLGFDAAPEVCGQHITFDGKMGELDDVFVLENLIVLAEYTAGTKAEKIKEHLQKKKIFFSKIMANPKGFVEFLSETFPDFKKRLDTKFHADDLRVKLVYASRYPFDDGVKQHVTEPIYLDYPTLMYFDNLAKAIKRSCRFEFFDFLGLKAHEVAEDGVFPKESAAETYHGSVLPEKASGYPPGYKVVSFYADAASLLRRAFVVRRNGWRASPHAYQRLVQHKKIDAIRRKLRTDEQVFVNNLIATLPEDVHPVMPDGKTIDVATLTATAPVKLSLPLRSNSVGMIDGQHRLYSYHEARQDDPKIAQLRKNQNLLVTGIIYPKDASRAERERFEANLFLSINSNQTSAPQDLRQEIEVILRPFGSVAIGRQVMQRLAQQGPLKGHVEAYFFEKGKLKTTSIVAYGLGPLIKLSGDDTLFRLFQHPNKPGIEAGTALDALEAYIQFVVTEINTMLGAARMNFADSQRWTSDPARPDRVLTVTFVIAFLIMLRMMVKNGDPITGSDLKKRLQFIDEFDTGAFRSSQYRRMAEAMYHEAFP